MPRDTFDTLIKVRRLASDEALRSLVTVLETEERALSDVRDVERSIAVEAAIATDPESSDAAVEAFGHWLPEARQRLTAARVSLQAAQAETARRRAELTACRTALESVESLQQQRRQAAEQTRAAKLQRELDDRPRHAGSSVVGPDQP